MIVAGVSSDFGPYDNNNNITRIDVSGNDGNDVILVEDSNDFGNGFTPLPGNPSPLGTDPVNRDVRLYGGNGNDLVYGDTGDDTVFGCNGNDSAYGGNSVDTDTGGRPARALACGGNNAPPQPGPGPAQGSRVAPAAAGERG
jgi:Ca2+-binding RTX toxin-like protein